MRVRLCCLRVHARTNTYRSRRASPNTACLACGAPNQALSHLILECSATSASRDAMFAELRRLPRCAEILRNLLALTDASDMVLCFVCVENFEMCTQPAREIWF
jgi:hypothetical protein